MVHINLKQPVALQQLPEIEHSGVFFVLYSRPTKRHSSLQGYYMAEGRILSEDTTYSIPAIGLLCSKIVR